MLLLSRKIDEKIDIIARSPRQGDHIEILVADIKEFGGKTKIGISAPKGYKILRRELTKKNGLKEYIRSVKDHKDFYFDQGGGI